MILTVFHNQMILGSCLFILLEMTVECFQLMLNYADEEWYNKLITFLRTPQNYALTARDTAAILTPADENGLLPLHHALQNNAPLGSIKLLLRGNSR